MEFRLQPGFSNRQCKTRLKPELHASAPRFFAVSNPSGEW